MRIEDYISKESIGVFYGLENHKVTLDKQFQLAVNLTSQFQSCIIKQFVDSKQQLLVNSLTVARKGLLDLMSWVVHNNCDFIICYDKEFLYDDRIGKQKVRKFIVSNQIPVLLCKEKTLFHAIVRKCKIPQQLCAEGFHKSKP